MTSKIDFKRSPETGLSILVVGGGIGGLCFAIEAYRKGHNVRIVERRPGLSELGKSCLAIQTLILHPVVIAAAAMNVMLMFN
jgi:2-polyprenyl-6-methoxyphenol hydroxylase-like FAD-dependent oxidoreductase